MPWYPDVSLDRDFAGLMAGEPYALIRSFAGEPELHHPVRGLVKGSTGVRGVSQRDACVAGACNVSVEDIDHVVTERRGFEEVVLHLDGQSGRVDLPVAVVADRRPTDGSTSCASTTALAASRPTRKPSPAAAPDPELRLPDVVGEYHHALAAGDLDAILAAVEPDGYVREPAGDQCPHRGPDRLREFYQRWLSNGGGIPL